MNCCFSAITSHASSIRLDSISTPPVTAQTAKRPPPSLTHVIFLQALESNFVAQIVNEQILLKCLQRTLRNDDICRSVGPDNYELRRPTAACQRRDEIERGGIDPVKVFQDEDQRILRRHHFECFADLPHHTFARGPKRFSPQCLSLFGFHQR